ncbi:hypothetical protein IWQ62_001190 [Dispira parvispora]|uniref:Zn(2)-C6 fungal-type domain-containing protein n=1 Tax=Dispira parvispora TaxID=1520584 RepID=A0A9W8E9C5_9FUNG|nr:hypothetical protein IWQ62_001190 [Dispira parvispora]
MQELTYFSDFSNSTDRSQRVGNAVCEYCRRRKLKCDRKRPSCSTCWSRSITCRYTLPPKRQLRVLAEHHQVQNRSLTGLPSLYPKNPAFEYSPGKTYPTSSPSIIDINGHNNEIFSFRESSAGFSSSSQSTSTLPRGSPTPLTGLLSSTLRPQDLYQIDRWVEESRRQFHRMSLSPPPCGQGKVNSEHSDSDSVASAASSATTVVSYPAIAEPSGNLPDLYWQDPFTYVVHRLVRCGTRIDSLSSLGVTGRLSTMTIPPSLFSITDILFHNDILLYFMYMFSKFICPENPTAYYNRLVFRYRKGWISKSLRLALAVMLAPLSVHPALSTEEWLYGSLIYRHHVEIYIQECLEDHDNIDSYVAPWVLSQYVLSIGEITKAQLLIAMVTRKLQQWRCHLIDLPNPPPDRYPPLQDKVLDLTQVKSPLYKNTMRIVWWENLHSDIILSLLLAQPPNVDLSTVCVNHPVVDEETRARTIEAIQDPSSQVHSDPKFPSFLCSFSQCRGLNFAVCKFRELAFEIAVLRTQSWSNLEEWLGKIASVGHQLQTWSTELQQVKLSLENSTTETLPKIHKDIRSLILQTQIFHMMLLFFLYHSPGPVLSNTVTSSEPESPTERGDYFSPFFYQKSWETVVALQALTSKNGTQSIYYENTTFASTLAIAGIICIETMERSQDPKVIQFAETFLDDILAFLNRMGRLWVFNANLANKLRSWSESPRPWIPIVRLIT